MTLDQFDLIHDKEEKLAAVLLNGEWIVNRMEGDLEIELYQLCSFYVEIMDTSDNGPEVLEFRSFSSTEQLRPYLDEIDISEVIR